MKILDIFRMLYAMMFTKLMNQLPRFARDRRGVTGMVIALVVGLVALAVIIPIGVLIASNLNSALEVVSAKGATTTQAENVTYDVFANIWTAFSLSALVPIIAVAGLLIAIIVGAFAIRARQG